MITAKSRKRAANMWARVSRETQPCVMATIGPSYGAVRPASARRRCSCGFLSGGSGSGGMGSVDRAQVASSSGRLVSADAVPDRLRRRLVVFHQVLGSARHLGIRPFGRRAAEDRARTNVGGSIAHRHAHRRGRLSGPERGDPRRRPQGRRAVRPRDHRLPPRLARADRGRVDAAPDGVDARAAAARRHDPRHVAHESLQDRRRTGAGEGDARARRRRRGHRDRRRGHARRRAQARPRGRARRRACRRRSTTISPPPTSRSASTPRCRSRPTPSTACTRRRRATTGSWSSR